MELYELMINTYTGKGPSHVAIKQSSPRYELERNLLSYDPWSEQSVDVTANKHVTIFKSKILKDDLLSMFPLQEILCYSLMSITYFLQQYLKRLGHVTLGAPKALGAPTT